MKAGRWAVRQSSRYSAPSMAQSATSSNARTRRPLKPSGCRRATTAKPATALSKIRGSQGSSIDPKDSTGRSWHRATICVSSQVGCAVNCQFCLTAKLGLQRNLSAGEIAGQVVAVLDRHGVDVGRDRVNLVFMGMGEPFLNYDNFMAAVTPAGARGGLSPQRMTVSTSGIVPGIERFAQEPADLRPKLAISLNAPNDQIRDQIMPINRKWPIEAVMDAVAPSSCARASASPSNTSFSAASPINPNTHCKWRDWCAAPGCRPRST